MSAKNGEQRLRKALSSLQRYLVYFVLMSFIITCCMLLFLTVLQWETGIILSEAEIGRAARITFLNVVLLSLICTAVSEIRRKFTVERPVKRIVLAAKKIMRGEFAVRIKPLQNRLNGDGDFNEIIDCFNRMAEELSGIETLRTDFIANVSHELKTPLSVIQNYGIMLQREDLPKEKRLEYAKAVTEASRSLSDLIANVLRLNKLENQEIYPSAANYDLGEQLCECLLAFEDIWEQKGLEIETDIEENVTVVADAEMLSLVWNNLFSNAVKFTERGGTVSLSVKKEGDFAIVKIADTGCGISKETGAHIFEKFYQGDVSHSAKGNGLGLALVKRVMDIVEGDISVESEPGRGSAFTVRIRRNV